MFRKSILLAAFIAFAASTTQADPATDLGGLARRGYVGAGFAPAEKVGRGTEGIVVQKVFPGTPAERSGLKVDDLIKTIDGEPVTTAADVVARVFKSKPGSSLALKLEREGATQELALKVEARPQEGGDGVEVIYDAVAVKDFKVRSIWTKPEGDGPFPTLLIIQGVHCGSMESAIAPYHESYNIAHQLAKLGYAVMRVEKPGVGDSQGPPCGEIDFETEVETFRRALADAEAKSFVAKDRVYLFGHSMGGIIAPILATETSVAGVSAFGTSGIPWQEYLFENTRRQKELGGADQEEVEATLRVTHRFHSLLFEEGLTIAEIREKHPEVADMANADFMGPNSMFGRSCEYWQQMEQSPRMPLWKHVECPVLMIWGEADYVTNAHDHQVVVDAVNGWRPGTARYVAMPNADHGITQYTTQEAAMTGLNEGASAPFNAEIIGLLDGWMKDSAKKNPPVTKAPKKEG